VHDLGLKNIEAQISERKQNWPEMKMRVSFTTSIRAGILTGTGSDAGDHFLSGTNPGVVTHDASIHSAIYKNAIHPAFQDSRHAKPPEWEVYNQEVAIQYALGFGSHVFGYRIIVRIKSLFGLRMKYMLVFS